jgi:hypothetical protein
MNSRFVVSGLTALALSLVACGGDSTGPKGTLSADESTELAMQLASTVQGSAATSASAQMSRHVDGLNLSAAPVSLNLDTTVPCPLGGQTHLTLAVSGTVDQQTQTATLDLTGTNTPQECGYHVKQTTVHVTGHPSLTSTAHVSVDHGQPVGLQSFTAGGGFSWSTDDGRSGSCTLEYTASANYTTNVVAVHGSVCGTTIDYSGPIAAPAA